MSQDCKKITISSIANTIFSNYDKDDYSWFLWPPDVFSLISIIFQRTGVYKFCLHESKFWKDLEYDQKKNDFTTPFTKMILTRILPFIFNCAFSHRPIGERLETRKQFTTLHNTAFYEHAALSERHVTKPNRYGQV